MVILQLNIKRRKVLNALIMRKSDADLLDYDTLSVNKISAWIDIFIMKKKVVKVYE